jgi:hypothetical protein
MAKYVMRVILFGTMGFFNANNEVIFLIHEDK